MRINLLLLLLILTNLVHAQDSVYVTGLVDPCPDELDKYMAPGAILSTKASNPPKSFYLTDFVPVVGNQGNQSSCTAFSVCAAISILENQRVNRRYTDLDRQDRKNWYSPAFVFNIGKSKYPSNRSENCDDGITYIDAFNVVRQHGVAPHPYAEYYPGSTAGCHSKYYPTKKALAIAEKRKIATFQRVERNLQQFKALLSEDPGYPICISVKIDKGYDAAIKGYNNYIWSKQSAPILNQHNPRHAMVIVGYSDSINCFKVLDSKGEFKGDKGFIWLSYNLLETEVIYDAYVCSLDDRLLRAQRTTGAADLELQVGIPEKSWVKEGYFRGFNGFRISCIKVDRQNERSTYKISNHYTGDVLLKEFTIPKDQGKTFLLSGKAFTITQKQINRKHGWPFKPASEFDISFDGEVTKEQFLKQSAGTKGLQKLAQPYNLPQRNFTRKKSETLFVGPNGSLALGSLITNGNLMGRPTERLTAYSISRGEPMVDQYDSSWYASSISVYDLLVGLEIQMEDWMRFLLDENIVLKKMDLSWRFDKFDYSSWMTPIKSKGVYSIPEEDQHYLETLRKSKGKKNNLIVTGMLVLEKFTGKGSLSRPLSESLKNRLRTGIQLKSPDGRFDFNIQLSNEGSVDVHLKGDINVYARAMQIK